MAEVTFTFPSGETVPTTLQDQALTNLILARLHVMKGDPGESVTVLAFEASQQVEFEAAVAAHAQDPTVLVIRYAP